MQPRDRTNEPKEAAAAPAQDALNKGTRLEDLLAASRKDPVRRVKTFTEWDEGAINQWLAQNPSIDITDMQVAVAVSPLPAGGIKIINRVIFLYRESARSDD